MTDNAPHFGFELSEKRTQLAKQMSDQLRGGYTIAVVAPPRYQSEQFARAVADHTTQIMGAADFIDIELEKFAFHPAPLPAMYADLLNRLGVAQTASTEDQLLKILRATKSVWNYRAVIFHTIGALPRHAQMMLSTVLRSFGNDPQLEKRIRPIVTGGIELLQLTQSNDLGISPLNGAEVIELQPFSDGEIVELFPWKDCFGTVGPVIRSAALEIEALTGGHPGMVSLLAQRLRLKRRAKPLSVVENTNLSRTIWDIGLSVEMLEHRFVDRTLQRFRTSVSTFRAITAIIAGKVPQIERAQFEAMRLTGAIVSIDGKLRLNGQIFEQAARRSFVPSAIPETISASAVSENKLTYTRGSGVQPTQTVKKALEQVAHLLVHCFGNQYVHVFVADETRRTLQGCLVICGLAGGEPKHVDASSIRVPYHKPTSLVGRAAKQMESILSRDVVNDEKRDIDLYKMVGSPTGALLNLPITLDGKELIGVLGVGATSAEELEEAAPDLRRLARDIAPVLKQQQLALLRQLLTTDAQKYGDCYTRRDVAQVLCDSLHGALSSLSVAVFRRAQSNWELISQTGHDLTHDSTVWEMVEGHLGHISVTPSRVSHRMMREGKPIILSSVAVQFHTQAALVGLQSVGGVDFSVVVLSEAPFDSPEHHVLETFETMMAAAQLAVSPLRLVSHREYTMLQYLYREALHALVSPLWDVNMSCTLLETTMSGLVGNEEAVKKVEDVRHKVMLSLQRVKECREELQAVLSHSNDEAVTRDLATEVLHTFENVKFEDQSVTVPPVKGHPIIWRQCIRNLISNARESSAATDPIFIIVRVDAHAVHILVRDQGSGLPVDVTVDKLFEPGFTTKRVPSNEARGFGLAFCRMMIEDQFGGTLSISNREDGRGVEATMSIPRATTGVT